MQRLICSNLSSCTSVRWRSEVMSCSPDLSAAVEIGAHQTPARPMLHINEALVVRPCTQRAHATYVIVLCRSKVVRWESILRPFLASLSSLLVSKGA